MARSHGLEFKLWTGTDAMIFTFHEASWGRE